MSNQTTITVLGAGYVGLTTAAILAQSGYHVYLIEPNAKRLDVIKQGRSFFYEEGLDAVIAASINDGTLIPTDSYEDSVPRSSVVISCVGTPDNPDGSSNLSYVFTSARQAKPLMKRGAIYVQKSTVPVGTGRKIIEIFSENDATVSYVSNPEFLREGTALQDTLYFDRIVAGGDDPASVASVLDIYRAIERSRDRIAKLAGIDTKQQTGQYIASTLNSAELIKVSANAFLALKISFANSIAKLADKVDADITEVMDAIGADDRIGRAFLNAGRGYGGGCFPKDVSGLIASGLEHNVAIEVMQAAQEVNQSMPGYIVEKLSLHIGDLHTARVAVLGLAFKAGTSDVRKSPGVAIANTLARFGASVVVHDPKALDEARSELHRSVEESRTIETALENADVVIIATEWPEYRSITVAQFQKMRGTTILDAMNMLDKRTFSQTNLMYLGVGR